MALMVSVSGIRGIFGTDLTPENLARFTAAFGTWAGGKVVVGRDSRVTGKICEDIVIASLQSVGCDVVSLGIVPTPTVAMGVIRHKAAGGIVISASHNPAQWNALKLLNSRSEFLDADQGREVMRIADSASDIGYVDYSKIGSVSTDDSMVAWHIDQILALPDVVERVDIYREHADKAKAQLLANTTVYGNLAVLDLRNEGTIYATNRFMIYALFPQTNISIHVLWGLQKQNTVFATGKSILDRSSKTNVGELMLQYGGGGHQAAGTCQVDNDRAAEVLAALIKRINADG